MLPGCCRKLSRAARARSLCFSCSEKYSLTASSLRSPSSPSPPPRDITLSVAVDQRSGVLSRASSLKLYRLALPPVKVSHRSASRLQRLFARKFSSVSKHERARSSQTVVVVESPAKAKTLQGFLGPDFLVLPCHVPVRVLAAGVCSVRPEDDYSLRWEVPQAAQPHVARIQNACKSAEELVLATNPDREGEALAWHITQLVAGELSQKKRFNFQRLVCNQFTKRSVLFAMQALQRLRLPLVDAHLANCALDHLSGFSLSPLLWIKLSGSPSAGRLHLAALQLVCEREKAVKEFVPQGYWRVEAYTSVENDIVPFLLTPILTDGGLFDMNKCSVLADKLTNSTLKVSKISRKLKQRHSPKPYTTATLLEDSQDSLGFEAELTMSLAQKLYEGVDLGNGEVQGLITYPFTDEAKLSMEAVRDIQRVVGERFGNEYIHSATRSCGSDLGTTLETHEAIRPTDMWKFPSALSQTLAENVLALYTLIWKRSVECQMEHAINEEFCVEFVTEAEAIRLQATFSHLAFNGFFAASMGEGNLFNLKGTSQSMFPNNQESVGENYNRISSLKEGAVLFVEKAHAQQHFTSGPARYSEGQLVNGMADAGLGRPLSFASILKLLKTESFYRQRHL